MKNLAPLNLVPIYQSEICIDKMQWGEHRAGSFMEILSILAMHLDLCIVQKEIQLREILISIVAISHFCPIILSPINHYYYLASGMPVSAANPLSEYF